MKAEPKPLNIQLSVRGVVGIFAEDIESVVTVGDTLEVIKKNGDVIPVESTPQNLAKVKQFHTDKKAKNGA